MPKKIFILSLLTTFLMPLAFSLLVYSQQTINKGELVSDTIPPNSYKEYNLSEELPKGSVFTICIKLNEGRYGMFSLQRGTERVMTWTVGMDMLIPMPYYYLCFITRSGAYLLNVTSISGERLNYTFFYDFSEPLQTDNTKSIPLEGGIASYYVDLNSGDRISLNLTSPPVSDFDVFIYFGYSYMMVSPPIGYTMSSTSPEALNCTAKNEGRHFIFVTSMMGTGTFYMKSSISYENLQANYESLQVELDNVRNLMYIFIITTIIFTATTVYVLIRKPKVKTA